MRAVGIRCPVCGGTKMPSVDGRVKYAGPVTIRIRECKRCAQRVETREMLVRKVVR